MNRLRLYWFPITFVSFMLVVYSYSQIDLNLTLSSNLLYQHFQGILINLGYFNRPLSALIYAAILLALFINYGFFILKWKKISFRELKTVVILSTVILFFSYPAFSHDFFNYMFDARIVTKYFTNPYIHSALDFPTDLWIRFMHWTHRTYPYGPVWLAVTLVPSFFGFGKFVLTLFNFKLMFALLHLGNIMFIYKIAGKINSPYRNLSVITYALNPLILVESLVSSHNETLLLFFLLAGFYAAFVKRNIKLSYLAILFSAGVKFVTAVFLPFFVFEKFILAKGKESYRFLLMILIFIPVLVLECLNRQAYPWYFIPLIGLASLVPQYSYLKIMVFTVSLGISMSYVPYLYAGIYSPLVSYWENILFIVPVVSGVILCNILFIKKRLQNNN